MIYLGCEICFKEKKEERFLSGKDLLIYVLKLFELVCYVYSSYLGEYFGINFFFLVLNLCNYLSRFM